MSRSMSRRELRRNKNKGEQDASESLNHSIVCLAYFFLFFFFKRSCYLLWLFPAFLMNGSSSSFYPKLSRPCSYSCPSHCCCCCCCCCCR